MATATVSAGTSRVTTALAPMTALSSIRTPCKIVAFAPTHTVVANSKSTAHHYMAATTEVHVIPNSGVDGPQEAASKVAHEPHASSNTYAGLTPDRYVVSTVDVEEPYTQVSESKL